LFKKIKGFLKENSIKWVPGVLVSLFFMLYSFVFNTSFSYMGNEDSSVMTLVLANYKMVIGLFLLKLIAVYLFLGVVLNLIFYYGIRGWNQLGKNSFSLKKMFWVLCGSIFFFWLLQFFKKIVLYPQMFIDSFYEKSAVFALVQEFLTENFSPGFFGIFQNTLLTFFFAGILVKLYKVVREKKGWFEELKKTHFLKRKKLSHIWVGTASLSLILLIFFFNFLFSSHSQGIKKPNLLILSSDALRPDHFSGYGYERKTTPHIDTLIQKGASFTDIYTVLPRTFPSWVSLLTSQYPAQHGIRHMFPTTRHRNKKLKTMAAILKENGYHTAVMGGFAADIFPRIDLGFDTVKAPDFNLKVLIRQMILKNHPAFLSFFLNERGIQMFPSIKEFVTFADPNIVLSNMKAEIEDSVKDGKPFYINVFLSVTHFPFSSPYPFYQKYTDPEYKGSSRYLKNINLKDTTSHEISETEKKQIRALYDGCLNAFDDAVGESLKFLKEQGLLKNTIVVIVSDHGENLYEYEYGMGHGEHLRGKYSLKVPMILSGPGVVPQKISRTGSTVDFAPTILDVLGISKPETFNGQSLLKPREEKKVNAYFETGIWFENISKFFFQKQRILYPGITRLSTIDFSYRDEIVLQYQQHNLTTVGKHRGIISEDYKILYIPLKDRVEWELYDLRNDPEERKNLSRSRPEKLAEMKRIFFDFVTGNQSNVIIKDEFIYPVFEEPVF
jgi:arylsulfatase A-like enzyme